MLCSKRDEQHPYNFSVIGSLKATFQNLDLCLRQEKAIAELEESLAKQRAAAQQTGKRQDGRMEVPAWSLCLISLHNERGKVTFTIN